MKRERERVKDEIEVELCGKRKSDGRCLEEGKNFLSTSSFNLY